MPVSLPHDDKLIAVFKHHAVKNAAKTKEEGRPIFDDMEIVEVRAPGSRNTSVFPATSVSHWSGAQFGDEQVQVTYAERFSSQYRQFKMSMAQTKSGTPLAEVPFLTEGRRAELRALNVYTVEQLAALDGQELKNIGMFGRELKNQAEAYIAESKANAPNAALADELATMRARNTVLEEDMALLKAKAEENDKKDDRFAGMSLDQLRDYITSTTGHAPHGALVRKVLERMAREAQQKAA